MIKQVKCKCGKELVFHLDKAAKFVVKGFMGEVKVFHSWYCDKCGQEYFKEATSPIQI